MNGIFHIFALVLSVLHGGETAQNAYCRAMVLSNALPVQIWLAGEKTFNESTFSGVHQACWCQPFNASDEINIQIGDDPGKTITFRVVDSGLNILYESPMAEVSSGIYEESFTPEDNAISNGQIAIQFIDNTGIIAKTDCLDIRTSHPESILIAYSNHRNFAGINYNTQSPDQTYYIRVPARFFHERYPGEDDAIELTSSIITTAAQQKTQRLLEVHHAPYYFHKKLELVLKHQTVRINSLDYWEKEEPYEIELGNKKWPLKTATCYLTQSNSVVRNVL